MAINLSDNILARTNSPTDAKYGPYVGLTLEEAKSKAFNFLTKSLRYEGLTIGIKIGISDIVEYWFIGGVENDNLSLKAEEFNNTIPIFNSESDVPLYEDRSIPDEVLIADSDSQVFTIDEEKEMMMQAIYELQKEVSLMKRSFTEHMDGGDFLNDKMIIEGNNNEVVAEEPLWASDTGLPVDSSSGVTVPELEPINPNVLKITHLTIKSGKFEDLPSIVSYLLPDEMVWVYDLKRLYIKQRDGGLYWINNGNDGGTIDGTTTTTTKNNTLDMSNLTGITFVSPNLNSYLFRINNDGETELINQKIESAPIAIIETDGTYSGLTKNLYLQKLYINSIYCGGADNEIPLPDKYQPCSHNFVELSNLTDNDIGLNNIVLRYSQNGTVWNTLRLEGIIKAKSTFLIRGAECSIMDANTTIIKVKTYDMEWFSSGNQLIKFSNIKCKFLLEYYNDGIIHNYAKPHIVPVKDVGYCTYGYIDMVGMNKPGASDDDTIDGYEGSAGKQFANLVPSSRLYHKYFYMDNVSQATKSISARDNSKDWYWVELNKNLQPNIELYTPKASFENKNFFTDKTKLNENKPNMITVTFGKNAHTTRCFNWISVGYYDEFLWYRVSGSTDWSDPIESFKNNTGYTNKFYNRIRVIATDGTPYTAHKLILKDLQPGIYEYKCGRIGYESDIRRFRVNDQSTESFSFVQISDQQGFNWSEYQVWKKAADFIKDTENPLFTLNTGDMTQNGNRINEWLDYYNAGEKLFNGSNTSNGDIFNGVEQMNVIGNNDLSPKNYELLGDGGNLSKINSINFQFFYTYEIDEINPQIFTYSGVSYYIPSLYSFDYNDCHFLLVNSEISTSTMENIYGDTGSTLATFMKNWCEIDLSGTTKKWKIAATHEMPFTIITKANVDAYLIPSSTGVTRGLNAQSKLNTINSEPYWFSKMLEKYSVRLCIGGHKHSYSCSYPLKENYELSGDTIVHYSMKPIIQVLNADYLANPTKYDNLTINGLCELEILPEGTKISAPIYVMCQSTGYKLFSNVDIPAANIPWLESYYPGTTNGTVVNAEQKYPFYIVWNINSDQIVGNVWKLDNIMKASDFKINDQNTLPILKIGANGTTPPYQLDKSKITINY